MVSTREELVACKRLVGRIIGFYLRVFFRDFCWRRERRQRGGGGSFNCGGNLSNWSD